MKVSSSNLLRLTLLLLLVAQEINAFGVKDGSLNGLFVDHKQESNNKAGWWLMGEEALRGEVDGGTLGRSLALAKSGKVLAAGAPCAYYYDGDEPQCPGYCQVYTYNEDVGWTPMGQQIDGDASEFPRAGHQVSLDTEGNRLAMSNHVEKGGDDDEESIEYGGKVKVYDYKEEEEQWVQVGSDIEVGSNEDQAGWAMYISGNGQVVAVGSPNAMTVQVYHWNTTEDGTKDWLPMGSPLVGDSNRCGSNLALSEDGLTVAIGCEVLNTLVRVYRYDQSTSTWQKVGQEIIDERDSTIEPQPTPLAISSDGTILAVGAPYSQQTAGSIRVYKLDRDGIFWEQMGPTINGKSSEYAGAAIDLSSDGMTMAFGAPSKDYGGALTDKGVVRIYLYSPNADTWSQLGEDISSPLGEDGRGFGESVALSSDAHIVATADLTGVVGQTEEGEDIHDYRGWVSTFEYGMPEEETPSPTPMPTAMPTAGVYIPASTCFESTQELKDAVEAYISDSSSATQVATKYGYPIGNWCVSKVKDFSSLFEQKQTFNSNLDSWDTSQATSMRMMFKRCSSFNGKIESWDVRRVKDFNSMFSQATRFAGDLSKWQTNSAQDMSSMFYSAASFQSDLSEWNVAKVTSFESFASASRFLNTDISGWQIQAATNFKDMFARGSGLNMSLCEWGDRMQASANVDNMFGYNDPSTVSCPNPRDPKFNNPFPGPFCRSCGPTESPTMAPTGATAVPTQAPDADAEPAQSAMEPNDGVGLSTMIPSLDVTYSNSAASESPSTWFSSDLHTSSPTDAGSRINVTADFVVFNRNGLSASDLASSDSLRQAWELFVDSLIDLKSTTKRQLSRRKLAVLLEPASSRITGIQISECPQGGNIPAGATCYIVFGQYTLLLTGDEASDAMVQQYKLATETAIQDGKLQASMSETDKSFPWVIAGTVAAHDFGKDSKNGMEWWVILLIVIGGVLGLGCLGFVGFGLLRNSNKGDGDQPEETSPYMEEAPLRDISGPRIEITDDEDLRNGNGETDPLADPESANY